jgi:mevalonate kinase
MNFPAKILLFGEYGILMNSMALCIPYERFSGGLRNMDRVSGRGVEKEAASNASLMQLLHCIKSNKEKFPFLQLERFEAAVLNGMHFDSTIPEGYGLGSSGALTAAIYRMFATDPQTDGPATIQSQLAAIESCFHGVSSGIDPLTSLLGRAVLLENDPKRITTPDLSPFLENCSLYLIDTHIRANTGDLVSQFMERCNHQPFRKKISGEYIPLVNHTIEAATGNDPAAFFKSIANYSQFQLDHFEWILPPSMRKYFFHGIETGDFHLKICGSGGGGYLLALVSNRASAENYFKMNHLDYTIV